MTRNDPGTPLLKWITRHTPLSRRKAFQAIVSGEVRVDGVPVSDTGFVIRDTHRVTIQGKPARKTAPPPAYILLYKPKGVVTSTADPTGRPTVLDLVKKARVPLFPVGRLDIMTQGILLLTNDGALGNVLTHPRYAIPRTYHVKLKGKVPHEVLETLRRGKLRLDGKPIRPVEVEIIKSLQKNTWLKVTITEGRNREVRRMFERFNIPVLNLIRVRFGPLTLKGLRPGQWRPLTEKEISQLKRLEKAKKA